jgi:hypothetical protein
MSRRASTEQNARRSGTGVSDDRVISLLCEKRSEQIAECATVVWHQSRLAELR